MALNYGHCQIHYCKVFLVSGIVSALLKVTWIVSVSNVCQLVTLLLEKEESCRPAWSLLFRQRAFPTCYQQTNFKCFHSTYCKCRLLIFDQLLPHTMDRAIKYWFYLIPSFFFNSRMCSAFWWTVNHARLSCLKRVSCVLWDELLSCIHILTNHSNIGSGLAIKLYCHQLGMLLQAMFWWEGSSGHSYVKNSFFQHGGCSLIYLWTFIAFEHDFGDIVNEFHCTVRFKIARQKNDDSF